MPYTPPPDLAGLSLADIARLVDEQALPPVHLWSPDRSGDSEMRIAANGQWYHQGGPIRRPAMVRAFSRLLRRADDGGHWLVTPYEKLSIAVEDAPFVAVELTVAGSGEEQQLVFRLNSDDLVIAGPDHALTVRDGPDGPMPYLHVRGGLEARLARPVYYQLADLALAQEDALPHVYSKGVRFVLDAAA